MAFGLVITCCLVLSFIWKGDASLSLLGVRSKRSAGASATPISNHGEPSESAATFAIDTSSHEITKLHGKGLRFQVDSLEVAALDGLFKVTNSNVHFEKGKSVWKTTMEENTVSTYHNNRNVMFLDVSNEDADESKLKFTGDATFRDIWIADAEKARDILVNLCKTDRILHPLPTGVVDKVANANAVDQCVSDMASTHLSVGSVEDYISKLLVTGARLQVDTSATLSQLQDLTATLTKADKGGVAERSEAEERERVRAIMTEFEAVVDALRSELAGKVKGLGGSVDALRSEWKAASTRLSEVEASVSAVADQRVAPVEETVRVLSQSLDAQSQWTNSSISAVMEHLESNHSTLRAEFNQTFQSVMDGVADLHSTTAANFSAVAIAMSAVEEQQAATNLTLEAKLNSTRRELYTVIESSTTQLSADLRRAANSTEEVRLEVTQLAAQVLHHNASVAGLYTVILTQNSSLHAVDHRLTGVSSQLHERLNTSVSSLHAEVVAGLSASAQEHRQAQTERLAAEAALEDRMRFLASTTESMILGNVSLLTNATSALLEERVLALRQQILQNADANSVQWESLNASMTSFAAQTTLDLINATQAHWAATTAAIDELTANTSHVVARSNSILARAIGEVNSSVLLLAESIYSQVSELRSEVHVNTTTAVATLRGDVSQQLQNLALNTTLSLDQLRQDWAHNLHNQSNTFSTRLTLLDERLLREAEAAAVQTVTDKAEARRQMKSVNATLLAHIDSLHSALVVQQTSMDQLLSTSLDNLRSDLTATDTDIRALINDTSVALSSTMKVNLQEQHDNFTSSLKELKGSAEKALDAASDKLRYQLLALNATADKLRAEDAAQLEVSLAALIAADARLETSLNSSVLLVSSALAAAKDELQRSIDVVRVNSSAGISELEANMTALLRNNSAMHDSQVLNLNVQIDNTTKALEASIGAVLAAQVDSHSALENQVAAVRTYAADQSTSAQKVAHEELQQAVLQLREHSSSHAASVAAAANASLSAAIAALDVSQRALVSSLAVQTAANHSAVVAHVTSLNTAFVHAQLHIREDVAVVANAAHLNISTLATDVARGSAEIARQVSAVNASLSSSLEETRQNNAAATARVEAQIIAAASASRDSNSSVNKRVDAVDAALVEAVKSSSSLVATQALALEAHTKVSSTALASQWARTTDLVAAANQESARNISQLGAGLTRSIQDGDAALQRGVDLLKRDLSARVDSAEATAVSSQQQIRAEFASSLSSANATATIALASIAAKHDVLVNDVHLRSTQRDLLQNRTDASLRDLSSGVERLNAGLISQSKAVNSTLLEFREKQTAEQVALMAQVDERVRVAEVQQQLGAVAVQAVSNNTHSLLLDVGRMSTTLSGVEVQVATLHVKADSVQKQNDALHSHFTNITSNVLPQVYSQLGAFKQHTSQLENDVRSVASDLSAARGDADSRVQELRLKQTATESATQALAAELAQMDKRTTDVVSSLHLKFVDVAVSSNVTFVQLGQLGKVVTELGADLRELRAEGVNLSDTQRRVDALERGLAGAVESVHALEEKSVSSVKALREMVDAQAHQLESLSATVKRQQEEVEYLQGENRRLLRETASIASVDELRKLLFEMQNQMLAHSSKVLDVLLQPRSAVLVHAPSEPVAAGAENV